MNVIMVQSKFTAEGIADVEAAVKKVIVGLDAAQPKGIRYASLLLPDGEALVALLQVEDATNNPLTDLPEYHELLEVAERSRTEPPVVQHLTVTGSYRLF